jgi:hypothetical protein
MAWWTDLHRHRPAADVDQRSADPVAVLSREHEGLCRQACDPDEIAAVLEAHGLDDRRARATYGVAGTFEVAEALWRLVPWRPADDDPRRDLWRLPLWRALLRGLVYVLPPLLAALAIGGIAEPVAAPALLLATAATIAAGQALSVLGHLFIGRLQEAVLAALVRTALGGATLVAVLAVAAAALLHGPLVLTAAGAGQLVFVVAATVLIVQRRDLLLVALIAPGTLLAGVLAWHPSRPGAHTAFVVAAAATVVLTAAGAFAASPRPPARPVRALATALSRDEATVAGTAAAHGLGLTALAAGALVAVAAGRTPLSGVDVAVATLPLTTTLGVAEYLLHRARGRCVRGMVRARDLRGFAVASARELRTMIVLQGATTGAVAGTVLVLHDGGGADAAMRACAATYALLGVALLLCTTLMSLGEIALAARLSLGGGAVLVAVGLAGPVDGAPLLLTQATLVACLLLVAHRVTAPRFVQTAAHR